MDETRTRLKYGALVATSMVTMAALLITSAGERIHWPAGGWTLAATLVLQTGAVVVIDALFRRGEEPAIGPWQVAFAAVFLGVGFMSVGARRVMPEWL